MAPSVDSMGILSMQGPLSLLIRSFFHHLLHPLDLFRGRISRAVFHSGNSGGQCIRFIIHSYINLRTMSGKSIQQMPCI